MVLHMEMTPFLILRKALLGVTKLGDKCQIWCLCQIVIQHIKSSRIPVMENDVNITYQVMGRQQITQNIIHENPSRTIYLRIYIYILIISLNKCENYRI